MGGNKQQQQRQWEKEHREGVRSSSNLQPATSCFYSSAATAAWSMGKIG